MFELNDIAIEIMQFLWGFRDEDKWNITKMQAIFKLTIHKNKATWEVIVRVAAWNFWNLLKCSDLSIQEA